MKIFMIVFFLLLVMTSFSFGEQTYRDLFIQGKNYYDQGQYEEAVDALEKSIDLNSNFAPAFNYLGLSYKALNFDKTETVWYFKVATEIDPHYAQAYDNLGKGYYGLGYFDKAIESCKKALGLNPRLASAELSLGWIYLLGKSQPKEAIPYFKNIVERYKIPYAYYGLGLAYFMSEERGQVLEVITTLRMMNQEGLAKQLEDVIRGHYYSPASSAAPLVNIPRRPLPQKGILVESEGTTSLPKEEDVSTQTHDLGGQLMRIRLRGTMVNLKSKMKKKSKP